MFPAAIDDCITATEHFVNHASDFGVDPNNIGVAGTISKYIDNKKGVLHKMNKASEAKQFQYDFSLFFVT